MTKSFRQAEQEEGGDRGTARAGSKLLELKGNDKKREGGAGIPAKSMAGLEGDGGAQAVPATAKRAGTGKAAGVPRWLLVSKIALLPLPGLELSLAVRRSFTLRKGLPELGRLP